MLTIIILLTDIILINISFVLSFIIRYGFDVPEFNFSAYRNNFVFLTTVYIIAFVYGGVFKRRFKSYWDLFRHIFIGMFYGTLFGIVMVYIFRLRWASFPSSVFTISFFVGLLLLYVGNYLILKRADKIKKKVIVVGQKNINDVIDNDNLVENTHVDHIDEILNHEDVDEIIICEHIQEDKQLNILIYLLLKLKVSVVFSPAIYAKLISGNVTEKNSVQYLATFLGRKSDYEEFAIRASDIIGSLLMLLVFGPLIIVVAALVKATSFGPIFFKQERMSKDGNTFTLYKFRTMIKDAEIHTGPVLASQNDPRVTRIGRFLRSTRIDEIPQLINVILGDMSLVGPRPERPHFVKKHKALREVRLAVKPGLTGFAQVRSMYDLHPKHKIKYDYLYIQKRSLLLNLYIIVKTIPVMIKKKGQGRLKTIGLFDDISLLRRKLPLSSFSFFYRPIANILFAWSRLRQALHCQLQ